MNQDQPNPSAEPAQRIATAFHEAGHAVAAVSLGRSIKKVTIEAGQSHIGDRRLGACHIQKGRIGSAKGELDDDIIILLAGMVAEAAFTGQYCPVGAALDLRNVRSLLGQRVTTEKQLERRERRLVDKTENMLGEAGHASAVEAIARELLKNTTISGRAVKHLFQQAIQQHS